MVTDTRVSDERSVATSIFNRLLSSGNQTRHQLEAGIRDGDFQKGLAYLLGLEIIEVAEDHRDPQLVVYKTINTSYCNGIAKAYLYQQAS